MKSVDYLNNKLLLKYQTQIITLQHDLSFGLLVWHDVKIRDLYVCIATFLFDNWKPDIPNPDVRMSELF